MQYDDTSSTAPTTNAIAHLRNRNGRRRGIDLRWVPAESWTPHVGKSTDDSGASDFLESLQMGNSVSVVLRTSDDRSKFIVTDRNALEIYCRQFLTRLGYTVSDSRSRTDRS